MDLIEFTFDPYGIANNIHKAISSASQEMVDRLWTGPFRFKEVQTILYPVDFARNCQKLIIKGEATEGQQIVSEEFYLPGPEFPVLNVKYCAAERHDEMFQQIIKYISDRSLW